MDKQMMKAKFDIEKFDGTGDFGLWRIKMRVLLIQHGCEAAMEVLPADMEAQAKDELNKKAYSAKKLHILYTPTGRKISIHIDESNKTVLDLANIKEALTLKDVMATLNSKEIKERSKAKGNDSEMLYVRERTDRKDSRQSRGKPRSKSRGYVKKDEQLSSSGLSYDDFEVMMVICAHDLLDCIIDSGCSYHMTPMLDIFFDFLECDMGNVQLGDNRECKIRGIGKVRIQLKDGSSFVLHNVRYILELKRNLISLGTLEKEGFIVKLQSGKVTMINGSRVVLSGIRRDNCVYPLDGHAMAGKRYFSSIVDDYSRRLWVYILRFKHEAFGKFKEWKQLVEYQTGRMVKKLRTDNGLEFCNREFKKICIESGIARHLTVVETPQQNGLAERMNITLMDKVRCLLIQSGLPKTFWAEVTCMDCA
nr:zinc finger, CCHC-type [Tanacetum cinerariifolium]